MAKKKQQKQTFLSPAQYLKEKARSLEIGKCYVTAGIWDDGLGHVFVTRKHKGGKLSLAGFLVDVGCLGVKDSYVELRLEPEMVRERFAYIEDSIGPLKEINYNEAHNIIYGAVEFAEEAGISPDKSFVTSRLFLDEDTENIPLIEYEFGKDGKHFFVAKNAREVDKYLPILRRNLGDNFRYIIPFQDYDEDEEYNDLEDILESGFDFGDIFEKMAASRDEIEKWHQPYTYRGEYPAILEVKNPELLLTVSDPENSIYIPEEKLDWIMSLPRDEVREDLEKILLFNIGLSCDGIPEDMEEGDFSGVVGNSARLLGEVGNNTTSLEAVLEVLRQSRDFMEYHICDSGDFLLSVQLSKLGRNRLNCLMDFILEERLVNFNKSYVIEAVKEIACAEPDREAEVIDWFSTLLSRINEDFPNAVYTDPELNGLIVSAIMDISAIELLPQLKTLYDNSFVDLMACGSFKDVEQTMLTAPRPLESTLILDLKEGYAHQRHMFKE